MALSRLKADGQYCNSAAGLIMEAESNASEADESGSGVNGTDHCAEEAKKIDRDGEIVASK